ncbi:MAG: AMP-dependent synthetase [Chloroflexota bacterium]|nr:MAG: AMP-dependent synthetase [Chloroflexota bacterium]
MGLRTVADLNALARRDPGAYWAGAERHLDVRWSRRYDHPLDLSDGMPFARFFAGGRVNYVAAAFERADSFPDRVAIVWESEDGRAGTLTYAALRAEVTRAAAALTRLGIGRGDRVGIFMPLTPECAIATLACGLIGAIYTPIFSGYGPEAIAHRLTDSGARLLITADAFHRRGRRVPMLETAHAACALAPTVERVLVAVSADSRPDSWDDRLDIAWHDALAAGGDAPTADTATDDPFMLIYTSGTTGRPKAAVHIQGGFPIKAAHDLAFCFDVRDDDRVFWYSDIGWMMGPWLIAGTLMLGATMVLYDGAIDHPKPDRVWAVAERARATVLGISPTAVRALMRHPTELVTRHDLSSLRALGSTGEAWNEDPWWWYFRVGGGGRCPIVNYSGGTEIAGGIVSGSTVAPLWPCGFAGPTPDMAADVVDETGKPVRSAVGELVIRQPWVGMTAGFWNDRARYLETYWTTYPGIWRHGDWARIEGEGAEERWYIDGRSDDTIKIAGKRVGPAEVESVAVGHPAVAEAAAIGIPDALRGETLGLFVVPRPGAATDEGTRTGIIERVVTALGPTLRPSVVRFVDELPRTRNAKILRRLVRAAHLGATEFGDISALENPSAIAAVRNAR